MNLNVVVLGRKRKQGNKVYHNPTSQTESLESEKLQERIQGVSETSEM